MGSLIGNFSCDCPQSYLYTMKALVLFIIVTVVTRSQSKTRLMVSPMEDEEIGERMDIRGGPPPPENIMPALARQNRAVKDFKDYSNHARIYGSFGWYTDHPILLTTP